MKRIISFIISAVIVSVSMYGAIFAAEEGYKYNGNIANGGFEEGIWTKSGILRTDKVSLENGGRNGSEYALSVTRAKERMIIVGDEDAVRYAIRNTKGTKRFSALCGLLKRKNENERIKEQP